MTIIGRCHCGNIAYTYERSEKRDTIDTRACGCGFCRMHGGVYTSDPDGALSARVRDPGLVSRYRFGTGTADFHVCARCGVVPFVTCELDGRTYAVVNVNTFNDVDPARLRCTPTDFDGEDLAQRLGRRKANWIGRVSIERA